MTGDWAAAGPAGPADAEALRRLVADYAAAVDDRDEDGPAPLFLADGALVVPDVPRSLQPELVRSGHDVLARIPAALDRYTRTFHVTSDHRFDIDDTGDRARGDVRCAAHHLLTTDGSTTDTVWYLRYRDEYRRTADGWRFARRELWVLAIEEHAVSTVAPRGEVTPQGRVGAVAGPRSGRPAG